MRYIYIYIEENCHIRDFINRFLLFSYSIEKIGCYEWDDNTIQYSRTMVLDTQDMVFCHMTETIGNVLKNNFDVTKLFDTKIFLKYERLCTESGEHKERIIFEYPLEFKLIQERLAEIWRKKNKKEKFVFTELNIIIQ